MKTLDRQGEEGRSSNECERRVRRREEEKGKAKSRIEKDAKKKKR